MSRIKSFHLVDPVVRHRKKLKTCSEDAMRRFSPGVAVKISDKQKGIVQAVVHQCTDKLVVVKYQDRFRTFKPETLLQWQELPLGQTLCQGPASSDVDKYTDVKNNAERLNRLAFSNLSVSIHSYFLRNAFASH
eukprot:TRINITY_DN5954_c0_g1_i5.p2 TRINITY_DN5954_c0_g1~~TRINITY_DN5954_c0_g1_i5.p2  ORF type:complete len:134 (-),score=24.75 TRINITY_DN5954_c0_g1_i5:1506-1907(-)